MSNLSTTATSPPEKILADGLFEVFADFFVELRAAGVPISTTEILDAVEALRYLPLEDREALKLGLAAALVKQEGHWRTFETLFELYFSLRGGALSVLREATNDDVLGDGERLSASELAELALRALMDGGPELMAALARASVERFAGMEPGRPVGGNYYVFKTLRHLQTDVLLERLLRHADEAGGLEALVLANEYRRRLEQLRDEVGTEVNRRLVSERGPREVARAMRRPLPEDVDFMHLGREELAALERAVQPLARKLAVHLARKRRKRNDGRLDFRATMRRSLSSGGAPVDPRFKVRQRSKPELWALADISGSVAAFARFTLQLVYTLSSQFSRARSWAFIDGIDEVTDLLHGATDLPQAVQSINMQADVIWTEGHSDYGHALSELVERWGRELTPRTTVLVLGDARNNYHSVHPWAMAELARRARQVWWLNPEPRSYWDTGDSVLAQYALHCSGVYECRNLRQLRHFVEQLP
ncbi:MAG TPA: VWA domain-containing protein [Acidimicrobiales bacterium]|nr:VWA domain-containing protein [Acidimicrobiales bacterium]